MAIFGGFLFLLSYLFWSSFPRLIRFQNAMMQCLLTPKGLIWIHLGSKLPVLGDQIGSVHVLKKPLWALRPGSCRKVYHPLQLPQAIASHCKPLEFCVLTLLFSCSFWSCLAGQQTIASTSKHNSPLDVTQGSGGCDLALHQRCLRVWQRRSLSCKIFKRFNGSSSVKLGQWLDLLGWIFSTSAELAAVNSESDKESHIIWMPIGKQNDCNPSNRNGARWQQRHQSPCLTARGDFGASKEVFVWWSHLRPLHGSIASWHGRPGRNKLKKDNKHLTSDIC